MLAVRKPTVSTLRDFLARQTDEEFTYAEIGATSAELPSGYAINHTQRQVGRGRAAYDAACGALRDWHQLRLGWVDCWPTDAPLTAGVDVAVIGRALGLYWLNACRIAYVINEPDLMRFGYAHGTLPDHLAIGEERFLIEMDLREQVTIDILSFSKPNTFLARLGYPLIRRSQKRFVQHSAAHVEHLVSSALAKKVSGTLLIDWVDCKA